jgi:cytochrome c biogenesis protein CcdA
MYRAFLLFAAMVSGLALYLVADTGGFSFLGTTLEDILEVVGAVAVLVFGLILIVLGIRALLGQCNGQNNKPC